MFISMGGKLRHTLLLATLGLVCIAVLAFSKPYFKDRILSYISPNANPLTSGYQVQQSLIAVGSGQVFGRGLGQGIQKFKFLPESISDSIFAVLGEEMGFVGCVFIIVGFLFFVFRAFKIAIRSPDNFGGLLVVGIVILIISRSFMNIGSMLGIVPISGVPLAFFSQGGTAMLITLSEIGIILNISRFNKIKK
jgi:cell division protein FtsW